MKQGNHLTKEVQKMSYGYRQICHDMFSVKIRLKNDIADKVCEHSMLKSLYKSNSKNDCTVIYGVAHVDTVTHLQKAIMFAKAKRLMTMANKLVTEATMGYGMIQ